MVNILITDNQKLWPLTSGAPIRVYNLFGSLSKKYLVTYIGTTPEKEFLNEERQVSANLKEKSVKISSYVLFLNNYLTKLTNGVHTFDAITSLHCLVNKKLKEKIKEEAEKSEILIATHPWHFPCLKKFKNKKRIYDAHNCEYLLREYGFKKTIIGRIILRIIKKVERDACKKSDLVIACSEKDKEAFKKIYKIKEEKIRVIPNSIDTEKIRLSGKKTKEKAKQILGLKNKKTVLFVGTYYEPNNQALSFIIEELSNLKEYTFLIIGSINDYYKQKYRDKKIDNVRFYGKVDQEQLKRMYKASDIAINPMFRGSGINIKMLDYMAAGIPLITTPIGARGIKEAKNKENMIICEAENFKEEIKRLMNDGRQKERFRKKGREIIEESYDSKKISKELDKILSKL